MTDFLKIDSDWIMIAMYNDLDPESTWFNEQCIFQSILNHTTNEIFGITTEYNLKYQDIKKYAVLYIKWIYTSNKIYDSCYHLSKFKSNKNCTNKIKPFKGDYTGKFVINFNVSR